MKIFFFKSSSYLAYTITMSDWNDLNLLLRWFRLVCCITFDFYLHSIHSSLIILVLGVSEYVIYCLCLYTCMQKHTYTEWSNISKYNNFRLKVQNWKVLVRIICAYYVEGLVHNEDTHIKTACVEPFPITVMSGMYEPLLCSCLTYRYSCTSTHTHPSWRRGGRQA